MNERIRELAKEALDYAEKNQSAEVQQHWFKLYNEKFAELIVRECMECSDPLIRHYIDKHPEQEQAFLLAAIADYQARLKKHFGVEPGVEE